MRVTGCGLRVTGYGLRVAGPSIADLGFQILDWKKMDCLLRGIGKAQRAKRIA
ncbi:MAG: hypothetical protein JRF47_11870 [Deltaproteobacteria bacterium]|nr:hypothetical protein [Deltaproteobacteria bacterium]